MTSEHLENAFVNIGCTIKIAEKRKSDIQKLNEFLLTNSEMKKIFVKIVKDWREESYKQGFNDGSNQKSKEILNVLGITDLIENHSHRGS